LSCCDELKVKSKKKLIFIGWVRKQSNISTLSSRKEKSIGLTSMIPLINYPSLEAEQLEHLCWTDAQANWTCQQKNCCLLQYASTLDQKVQFSSAVEWRGHWQR
jgi:hypothetical protein